MDEKETEKKETRAVVEKELTFAFKTLSPKTAKKISEEIDLPKLVAESAFKKSSPSQFSALEGNYGVCEDQRRSLGCPRTRS